MTRVRRWTAPLTNEHRQALLVVVVVDNSANYLRAAANFARATGRRRHNRSAGSHTRALASGPKPEEARTGCIGGHPNGSPRVRPSARLSVCLCDGSGGRRSRSHERPRLPANCCTADRRSNDRSCCLLLLYVRVGSHVRTAAANFIRLPLRTGAPVWSGPLWSPPIQSEPIQPEADSAVGTRKGNTAARERERDARVRSRALAQREREKRAKKSPTLDGPLLLLLPYLPPRANHPLLYLYRCGGGARWLGWILGADLAASGAARACSLVPARASACENGAGVSDREPDLT